MSHGDRQTHSTKNNTVTAEMGHCKVAAPLPTRPTAHTLFSVVSNTHKTIPLKKKNQTVLSDAENSLCSNSLYLLSMWHLSGVSLAAMS